jgi:TIGR03009 family protein
MRRLGPTLAASLLAATVAAAQPPAAQPPAAQPPAAQPPAAPDPRLNAHLDGWEKAMGGLVNFSAKFDLVKTDVLFKQERAYQGSVLCMKPNLALLRIESKGNAANYEAFVCDGKSFFQYDSQKKAVYKYELNPGAGADNLMLDFLGGMKADDARKRFHISLFKEDANYVYLEIKPRVAKDAQEFVEARMALLAPTNQAKLQPYLPVQVWMRHPNQDYEKWDFREHSINAAGVGPQLFQYQPIPGWPLQQAPAPGARGPGAPGTPAPGGPGGPAVPVGGTGPR